MSSVVLELLHVVDVLVRLHVYGEVALGGGAVVADLTPVGFVAAGVRLSPGQSRVLLTSDAIDAGGLALRVLLLHVLLGAHVVDVFC